MDCFSSFEGKPLEENQKSYAISLIFERHDRTFQEDEIDGIMNSVMKCLEEELKAIIRR